MYVCVCLSGCGCGCVCVCVFNNYVKYNITQDRVTENLHNSDACLTIVLLILSLIFTIILKLLYFYCSVKHLVLQLCTKGAI